MFKQLKYCFIFILQYDLIFQLLFIIGIIDKFVKTNIINYNISIVGYQLQNAWFQIETSNPLA